MNIFLFTYFLRAFRCLAFLELSTGSVHCACFRLLDQERRAKESATGRKRVGASFPLFLSPSPPRFRPLALSFAHLSRSLEQANCAPDENDIPFAQTELYFAFVNLCCFLILFLVSSLNYVRKIFNIYLTLKSQFELKLHRFSLVPNLLSRVRSLSFSFARFRRRALGGPF